VHEQPGEERPELREELEDHSILSCRRNREDGGTIKEWVREVTRGHSLA
jgi:hypothetical protein